MSYPAEGKWMPGGPFVLQVQQDQKLIHGLVCKRVLLLPLQEQKVDVWRNEVWIASDWGLVVLDVAESPTEEVRWELMRLEMTEPDVSVFQIPQGFVTKQ